MASLAGEFNIQEFTDDGAPLVGGRLYTYVYGTTTQKTAYTDIAEAVPHTYTSDGAGGQYIGLNSRGELPAPLYLKTGAYDIALKRSDGSTVWTRRADGINADLAAPSGAGLIGANDYQTQAGKNAERYSILGHGAIGDGGTNNLSAITAAIAAANGRTIHVPVDASGGDYAITSGTLTIPSTARFVYEAGARIYASGGSISDSGRHFYLFGGGSGEGQASSLTRGVAVELNGGNSGTASASTLQFNRIRIVGDTLDAEPDANGTKVDGLLIHHSFGGTGAKGGRHAVEAILDQTALTEATNPDRNYVASVGLTQTSVGDGGVVTGNPDDYKGAYFGCNFYGRLNSGAVGVYNLTGAEFNSVANAGSSVWYRSGIQVVGGGAVQGESVDAGVSISNLGTATTTWRNAIRIGNMNGGQALGASSKILVALASGSITGGFEIPACTENILASGDVALTNTSLTLGAANTSVTLGDDNNSGTLIINARSSGLNGSYDSRFVFSGGTATAGNGVAALTASTIQLTAASEVSTSGTVRPSADNVNALGRTDRRWTVVYAATGTINTSDGREKQQVAPIDDAAIRAVRKVDFKQFKFNDAVAEKGDAARWHFGIIAQQVKSAFESEGLNPFEYGVLCYDEWDEQPEISDKDGLAIQEYRAAGNRYGVRYEELLCLKMASL